MALSSSEMAERRDFGVTATSLMLIFFMMPSAFLSDTSQYSVVHFDYVIINVSANKQRGTGKNRVCTRHQDQNRRLELAGGSITGTNLQLSAVGSAVLVMSFKIINVIRAFLVSIPLYKDPW